MQASSDDTVIWIKFDDWPEPAPIGWQTERFATFAEHVENYSQGWESPFTWGTSKSKDELPTQWTRGKVEAQSN